MDILTWFSIVVSGAAVIVAAVAAVQAARAASSTRDLVQIEHERREAARRSDLVAVRHRPTAAFDTDDEWAEFTIQNQLPGRARHVHAYASRGSHAGFLWQDLPDLSGGSEVTVTRWHAQNSTQFQPGGQPPGEVGITIEWTTEDGQYARRSFHCSLRDDVPVAFERLLPWEEPREASRSQDSAPPT